MAVKKKAKVVKPRTIERSDRERSVAQQVRAARKQPDGKVVNPLEGEFTSRGNRYSLQRMDAQLGPSWFIVNAEGRVVVRDLPCIGLLPASSLMCAFEDAVKAVPPKLVVQPKEMLGYGNERSSLDRTITAQREQIMALQSQLNEARRTIDVFARAAVTR